METMAAWLALLAACGDGNETFANPRSTRPQEREQPAATAPPSPCYSASGHDLTPLSAERRAVIAAKLTPLQLQVTRDSASEPAGSSALLREQRPGTYVCVVGGLPLFQSAARVQDDSGRLAFSRPIDPAHVVVRSDPAGGVPRVFDARAGAFVGRVHDDGTQPSGKRWSIQGAALRFVPDGEELPAESRPAHLETAWFAGGCFWGVEDVFAQLPGVVDAVSGYQGGHRDEPSYEQVCSGTTGHAESVQVVFDRDRVSYRELLRVFFANHDPTTPNRQGPDVGSQYRSVIFAADAAQEAAAKAYVAELQARAEYRRRRIVTRIEKAAPFWPAEEYHQDYHRKHGGSCRVK